MIKHLNIAKTGLCTRYFSNLGKAECILFGQNSKFKAIDDFVINTMISLSNHDEAKYLCFTIDKFIRCKSAIVNTIIDKANSRLTFLCRNRIAEHYVKVNSIISAHSVLFSLLFRWRITWFDLSKTFTQTLSDHHILCQCSLLLCTATTLA